MVKLWNALDPAQEQELLEVLKKNQIACFVKDAGAGEFMKITMGFSLAGRDIYVDEKDANKASRLIGQIGDEGDRLDESEREHGTDAGGLGRRRGGMKRLMVPKDRNHIQNHS